MTMIIQADLWRQILDIVSERRASDAEKIAGGFCKTMESYAEHVGYVRALDWVMSIAHELAEPKKETDIEEPD